MIGSWNRFPQTVYNQHIRCYVLFKLVWHEHKPLPSLPVVCLCSFVQDLKQFKVYPTLVDMEGLTVC